MIGTLSVIASQRPLAPQRSGRMKYGGKGFLFLDNSGYIHYNEDGINALEGE